MTITSEAEEILNLIANESPLYISTNGRLGLWPDYKMPLWLTATDLEKMCNAGVVQANLSEAGYEYFVNLTNRPLVLLKISCAHWRKEYGQPCTASQILCACEMYGKMTQAEAIETYKLYRKEKGL